MIEQKVQHRSLCPTCGRLAERETHKGPIPGGTLYSLYVCVRGHAWAVQWGGH